MQKGSLSCHAHRDRGLRFLGSRLKDLSVGRRIKSHKIPILKTGHEPGTLKYFALQYAKCNVQWGSFMSFLYGTCASALMTLMSYPKDHYCHRLDL